MPTDTIKETAAAEGAEESAQENNDAAEESGAKTEAKTETSKAPKVSEVDLLVVGGESKPASEKPKEESTVDADKQSGSTEDTSDEETSAASEKDKKSKVDSRAASVSAGMSENAFGVADPTLLVDAGKVGISPQLAFQLAKAGPDVLRNAIAEWSENATARESAESQEKKSEIPKIEIDREEYGDSIADAFDAMTTQLNALVEQNSALQSEVSGLKVGSSSGVAREVEADFDRQIEHLGDDWGELFGKGSSAALKGTPEHKNRETVFNKMVLDDAVREQLNLSPLTREESFNSALHGIHYKHATKLTTQAISKSVTKRSGQSIQKPAHGGTKASQKGRELAIETAGKKQKEFGGD
ncbi:hypothetical protein LCGC14_1652860 [marine sediment metagenome]|uniref:Uncharacterized protein n=1 Tax=marine sediment metagenome TaxID=412755 RepID=A0A0F9HWD0_9ZZZZ